MRVIAKPHTWFDAGTEAEWICDVLPGRTALFAGVRSGAPDEEVCGWDEFEIKEAEDMNTSGTFPQLTAGGKRIGTKKSGKKKAC